MQTPNLKPSTIGLAFILLVVSACKVAGSGPRPQSTGSENVVMNYFSTTNYALRIGQSFELASAMSGMMGLSMVAPNDSSFNNWSNPGGKLLYSQNDGLSFSPQRVLDVGEINLAGPTSSVLNKNEKNMSYSLSGRLEPGPYTLSIAGVQGSLSYDQEFRVPDMGSNIRITSGSNDELPISSPDIPSPNDPGYLIVIDKTAPLRISFTPPRDATYVRVQISDGSGQPEGEIIKFGSLDSDIVIPAGAMNYFRSTEDGSIFVDFVSVSLRKDIPKIKESLILSSTRHLHGVVDFYLDQYKQTARFGVVRFE